MNNHIYLVTGAAGFLGGTICRQLVERGEKVRMFVLPNDPGAAYLPKEVEICEGDLCDREAVSFKRFSRMVAEESGCKRIKFFLPGKLAYLMAGIMEKRAAKTGKRPDMTTYAVWNLIRNNEFDYGKAKRELGYTTRPFKETIHDQIAWMKSAKLI